MHQIYTLYFIAECCAKLEIVICSPTIVQYRAAVIGLVTGRMLGCLLCCWSYHSPGVALSGLLLINFFFFSQKDECCGQCLFFSDGIDLSLKDTERQWKSRIFKTFWRLCGGYSCPVWGSFGNCWESLTGFSWVAVCFFGRTLQSAETLPVMSG